MAETKPVVDIDINNIFFHLHEIAKEQAQPVSKRIDIANTAVDEANKTFVSAQSELLFQLKSEFIEEQLPEINKDKQTVDAFRQECFKVFQKYSEFFFGDQLLQKDKPAKSSSITIDALTPIFQKTKSIKESLDWRRPLLENLFNEAEEASVDDADPEIEQAQQSAIRDEKIKNNDDGTVGITAGGMVIGYRFQYNCDISGQKKIDYANNTARFMKKAGKFLGGLGKTLFGGIIDDITSTTAKTGFGDVNVGSVLTKLKATVGASLKYLTKNLFTGIDKDEFARNLTKQFVKQYPQSDITDVRAFDVNTLKLNLTKQKKMTTAIQRTLDNPDMRWPIVIVVPKNSQDYTRIDEDVVADVISNTFKADQKIKQKVLGLSNGLKNLTVNAAKFTADKTSKMASAVKGKITKESFGMDVGLNMLFEDESELTSAEAEEISSKSDEDAAEELSENPSWVKKTTASVKSGLNWLSDKADIIKQTLFYIQDGVSPFSRESIYNKKTKVGLDAYMNKVEGLKSKTKKVNESDTYSNPVVGSLIATLFEDDTEEPSVDTEDSETSTADTENAKVEVSSDGKEEPVKIASKSHSEELLKFFTDPKYPSNSWDMALDYFMKTEATDKEFKIKDLHLKYIITKDETVKGSDGKEQTKKVSQTKEITTFKEFADCIKGLLKQDNKEKAISKWLEMNKENLVGAKSQQLVDRMRLLADAISREESEDDKTGTDLYIYCNPYLKDKSEDVE